MKIYKCDLPTDQPTDWGLDTHLKKRDVGSTQGAINCATAQLPVAASAGALTLAGSPSIRAFVAKSILSRFTCFWMNHFQPQHTRFCREISFVALLSVSFSAIHGESPLVMNGYFMIMTLVQGCLC